jgi:predicted transcriptional regulator
MSTITELAAEILSAHASATPLTSQELLSTLQKIHATLKALEAGEAAPVADESKPVLSVKEAFKKNEVVCMVCGKGGFKTLTRHLNTAHQMGPKEYKKQFGIPAKQPLSAKSLTESRRKTATERNLAGNLEKARAARASKLSEKKGKGTKGK